MTGSYPEATSFDEKSPGTGWRRPKTRVYGTFHFLQGCNFEEAVTWQEMRSVTSGDQKSPESDFIWPEVTWKWLEKAKISRILRFHFIQGCSSQAKAVAWQKSTSCDLRWPEVTRKWRRLIGSHQEVPVEGRKLAYTVHFTFYKAAACRGGSHVTGNDVTWSHLTGSNPEVTSFDRNSPARGWRRSKTRVYCTFHFLQGCTSQEKTVTWRELTSRDLRWS